MRRNGIPRNDIMFRIYEMSEYGRIADEPIFEYEFLRWFVPSSYSFPTELDFRFRDEAAILEGGKNYYFSIFAEEGEPNWQYELAYNTDQYSGGTRYHQWREDTNWAWQSSGDLNFRMFAAIPEPMSASLLLPLGLVMVSRRRRRG